MRRSTAWFACGLAAAAMLSSRSFSQEQPGSSNSLSKSDLAAQEKQGCTRNLKLLYDAIQAYQADHKDLPNWLSDLVPNYLADVNVLVCPVCRRTGKTEAAPLADPKLPSSYLFEFCPVPLGALAPNAPERTRREWKRRQMGLLGSDVPVVRCRHHSPPINLSFGGKIFEAPPTWEMLFTNRVSLTNLSAAALFADEPAAAGRARFGTRDPKAGPNLLDLTRFYNAGLKEAWLGKTNQDLSALPKGLQKLAGVEFDVRGVIQLAGKNLADKKFPAQVKSISVRQKCKRLHFLHAAALASPADDGQQVASYVIRYTGNQARLEIPILCGRDVRNYRAAPGQEPGGLKPAWTPPKAATNYESGPRLFKTTWTNLAPEIEIESLDIVSANNNPGPFVVAITAD